jgi:hypothetical protein
MFNSIGGIDCDSGILASSPLRNGYFCRVLIISYVIRELNHHVFKVKVVRF